MRRLIFDADHELFRESARRFFMQQVAPNAAAWRRQGHVDRDIFLQAGSQGYLLMWAAEEHGGAGIDDFRYEQILIEENMRHGEIGFYHQLHSRLVAPYIGRFGTPEQQQRFLPSCARGEKILAIAMTESGAGSDLAGIKSHAVDKGDHWLLNGSKTYISNGQLCDLVVVAARTAPEQRYGIGLFVVEADMPGFRRGRALEKLGLKAQDTSELFFDDVKVPKTHVLGDPTAGFRLLTQCLAEERLIGACGSIAHAQAAFDITLEYVRERRAFGRPVGTFQDLRFRMAELRMRLDALQTFVDQCVLEHNAGRLTSETAAEVKFLTSELENRVMDEGVQMHGGAGYMEEYRISRMFADARVSRIFAGSDEIMREIVGRSLGLDERKLK